MTLEFFLCLATLFFLAGIGAPIAYAILVGSLVYLATAGQDIGLALVESLLILSMVILFGRYLLHPLLHRVALSDNPEIFTTSAVLIVLGMAYVTEHAGLSMAMGAFSRSNSAISSWLTGPLVLKSARYAAATTTVGMTNGIVTNALRSPRPGKV